MSLSEQLRAAIRASKESGNSIAKAAGISQPVMSRFLQGRDVKFSAAEKLAAHFQLELVKAKPKPTMTKAQTLKALADAGEASREVNEAARGNARQRARGRGIL